MVKLKNLNIDEICADNFTSFRQESELLEKDGDFEKVFLFKKQFIIKIFRHRKIFSTSRIKNKAKKFRDNSIVLQQRGISCSEVCKIFNLTKPNKRQCIVYKYIDGETFHDVYINANIEDKELLLRKFFDFFKLLHKKGIYFRSAHLANIIVRPDGSLALIDIGNIQFYRRSLSTFQVFRNFKAILRRKEDLKIFQELGKEKMLSYYFEENNCTLFDFFVKKFKAHPLNQL